MTYRLITPPVAMAVSLIDARNAARINGTDSDADIEIQVRAITADAEHETRRAIINQGWRVTLDGFPAAIRLDRAPLVSVESVKYFDVDGVERTLDPADYYVDPISEPGYVVPVSGKAWPNTAARVNAVTVDYTVGYGPDDTTTPDAFKGYILAKVKEYFAPSGTPESPYLCRLLDSLQVYG